MVGLVADVLAVAVAGGTARPARPILRSTGSRARPRTKQCHHPRSGPQTAFRPFLVHCRGHRPRESACNTTADNCRFKCFHWLFLPFCCAAPYGPYTPACCFTNQKTPLPCCVRSRIREYFLCAACQVWLYREHFSASIASTTISAQRASLGSATSMVYVSAQFQSSLAICATVCLLGARMS